MRRKVALFSGAVMLLVLICAGPVPAQVNRKTVWNGVFTAEQAARGSKLFASNCTSCHGENLGGGNAPALKGELFLNHWMEDSASALFTRVKSMPPNRATLGDAAYVDILAFLLETSAFPAGSEELKPDAVPNIQIEGKNGPGAVPNFSLIDVVGCLTQGPEMSWLLTNGTVPVRSRNPVQPTPAEVEAAAAKPTANQRYVLLDVDYFSNTFRASDHVGHKMNAKGFLIRTANDVRLNVTWLEMVSPQCGQ
jgi:hypothetical protein